MARVQEGKCQRVQGELGNVYCDEPAVATHTFPSPWGPMTVRFCELHYAEVQDRRGEITVRWSPS